MSKTTERKQRRNQKHDGLVESPEVTRPASAKVTPLEPQNESQRRYISAIRNFTLTFGLGPAGTGKTYIAGASACRELTEQNVERIVITRPAVDAGESLGFIPGEIHDKYLPYITPFLDVLNERLGRSKVEALMKNERIVAAPLAYMRGWTFKNSFVILDEAQNATRAQMQLFLTRIGMGCKVVVNGDESQTDIAGASGLADAVARLQHIPAIKVIQFGTADIVRSGLVQEIVESYSRPLPVQNDLGQAKRSL